MTELNEENVKICIAALRSKEYKKAIGALELVDENGEVLGNCCLGVFTREAMKHGVNITAEVVGGTTYFHAPGYSTQGENAIMPKPVMDWLGVNEGNPSVEVEDEHGCPVLVGLAALNDGNSESPGCREYSHEEIADILENKWL